MARRLSRCVPNGSRVTIEGSAHYPNVERPAEITAAVADFLAAHNL